MTQHKDIEIRCSDLPEFGEYMYVLFNGDKAVATEYSKELYNYALVTLYNGTAEMLLRESHAEANKLFDPDDPMNLIVTINHLS